MKNLEQLLEEKKVWTISIGDDKVQDMCGEFMDTQNAKNGAKEGDFYTFKDASSKAKELNKELPRQCMNRYTVEQIVPAKINLSKL